MVSALDGDKPPGFSLAQRGTGQRCVSHAIGEHAEEEVPSIVSHDEARGDTPVGISDRCLGIRRDVLKRAVRAMP